MSNADYEITVRARNARIKRAIRRMGFATGAEFCRATGFSASKLSGFLTMKTPAVGKRGEWTASAIDMATHLGGEPEDFFTQRQASGCVAVSVREMPEAEVLAVSDRGPSPEESLINKDLVAYLARNLNAKERFVVARRFGFGGADHTFAEIADEMGVTQECVRQYECRAIRKMKYAASHVPARPGGDIIWPG